MNIKSQGKKQTPVLIVNCAHGIKIQLNMKSPVAAKDSSYTKQSYLYMFIVLFGLVAFMWECWL